MRNAVVLFMILFTCSSFALRAQTSVYHHFPGTNSGAFWRADWSEGAFCMNLSAVYQYYYSGDTSIASTTYHKVMKTGAIVGGCYHGTTFGYQGALREDSITKQIFIVLPNDSIDKLLYDFSLIVGDTLHSIQDSLFGPSCLVVQQIDSIFVGNNWRKIWFFNSQCTSPYPIIEGIGSCAGLIDPLGVFEDGAMLACYTDTSISFQNPWGGSVFGCTMVYQGIEEYNSGNTVSLFPNPATERIAINSERDIPKDDQLIISDCYGRIIREMFLGLGEKEINISDLSDGLYYLSSKNNFFSPQKFSVSR